MLVGGEKVKCDSSFTKCKFSCCSVGKYHGLVVDASLDWEQVECAEEQGDMVELGKVEHQAACSVLDKLQGFDGTSGEPSLQCLD